MIYKMIRHRTIEEVIHVNLDPDQLEAFKRMEDPADWEDEIDLEVVETVGMLGASCGDAYLMDTIELLPPLEQLAAIKPSFVCDERDCEEMVDDEGDICEKCCPPWTPPNSGLSGPADDLGHQPVDVGLPL